MAKRQTNKYRDAVPTGKDIFTVQTIEYHSKDASFKEYDSLELTVSSISENISIVMFDLDITYQKKYYAKTLHRDVMSDIKQNPTDYIKIFQSLKEKTAELTSLLEQKLCDIAK